MNIMSITSKNSDSSMVNECQLVTDEKVRTVIFNILLSRTMETSDDCKYPQHTLKMTLAAFVTMIYT